MEQLRQTGKSSTNAKIVGGKSTLPSFAEGSSITWTKEEIGEAIQSGLVVGGALLAKAFLENLAKGEPKVQVEVAEEDKASKDTTILGFINELMQKIDERNREKDIDYYGDYVEHDYYEEE